jgi:outer membrane protein
MCKHVLAVAIAALSLSGIAVAHEPGSVILRVSAVHADPDVTSSRIKEDGHSIRRSGINFKSDTQAGFGVTYMVARRFGLEVAATTPFTHKINEKFNASRWGWDGDEYRLGKTSRMSPTVIGQFFFLNPKSRFQPYVGAGLVYHMFYNEKTTSERRNFGDLKLDDSVGLTAQVGLDYTFGNRFVLNTSLSRMSMSTRVRYRDLDTGERYKARVDIDPWMYSVGIGIKF